MGPGEGRVRAAGAAARRSLTPFFTLRAENAYHFGVGKLIGELLVEAKAITREKLEEALRIQREPGKKLGQLLLERGLVTEAHLTQCLSFQLSVPWVSLYHIDFSRSRQASWGCLPSRAAPEARPCGP